MTKQEQEVAIASLQATVDQFNSEFTKWTTHFDARVQFGWAYGKDSQIKIMEIVGIDQIIYRKPAPKSLGRIMDDHAGVESPSQDTV